MSSTTVSILGLLAMKSMHGYELNKLIKEWHMDTWARIPVSTVYRRLKQVETEGLVESKVEHVTNMPPRTVLTLTEDGRARLADLLIDLILDTKNPEDHFKLASFFIGLADPDRVEDALETRLEMLAGLMAGLEAEKEALPEGLAESSAMLLSNSLEHQALTAKHTRRYLKILRTDPDRFFELYPHAEPED